LRPAGLTRPFHPLTQSVSVTRTLTRLLPPDVACGRPPEPVAALAAALTQLFDLVAGLTDDQYTRKPGGALPSSIGGHVRHNLDHVAALLAGAPAGAIDYDRRDRGTPVETDRQAAMHAAARLEHALLGLAWDDLPAEVTLTALVATNRPPVVLATTPQREVAFVLSHTIHHNALIAVLAAAVGATPPAGFGYAPATVAYQRSQPCVL
ncbi:MAG: DinB family protein, partial [Gemmataceae bacterium]|nr:DinB family protein [Gemmataceae bacterium]